MTCTRTYCGCTCRDCMYARRHRKDITAEMRHCLRHRKGCHWRGNCDG